MNFTSSDYLVLIQLIATALIAMIGWALKNVLNDNLNPIQKDINLMRKEISEINEYIKSHGSDRYAHPNLVEYLGSKFAGKNETDVELNNLNGRVERLESKN